MRTLLTRVITALILVGGLAGCAEMKGNTQSAIDQLDPMYQSAD
jgi:hypothetical protein